MDTEPMHGSGAVQAAALAFLKHFHLSFCFKNLVSFLSDWEHQHANLSWK